MSKKIMALVCAAALLCGVLVLLPACGRQEAAVIETGAEGERLFFISLSYPYLDHYSIEVTNRGYLTTARGTGEDQVQTTVLLSGRTFSRLCKKLERLDFSSPPKTEAHDIGDVALYFSKTNQEVYFCYGYSMEHRKTDKPFVAFVKAVIKHSPSPAVNFEGKPIRPYCFFLW